MAVDKAPEDTASKHACEAYSADDMPTGGEQPRRPGPEELPVRAGPEVFAMHEDDDADILCEPISPKPSRALSVLRPVCWLLLTMVLACGGAWWGFHAGTRQRLQLQAAVPPASCAAGKQDVGLGDAGQSPQAELDKRQGLERVSGPPPAASAAERGGTASAAAAAAPRPTAEKSSEFPDLSCEDTAHAEWRDIKRVTGTWFNSFGAGATPLNQAEMHKLVDMAANHLQAVHDKIEVCGMGRLCVTLLAIASGQSGTSLKSTPGVHSPLLTILLDIPWGLVMRSGWPLFALMGQLHLRNKRRDDVPAGGHAADYLDSLLRGLDLGASEELAVLGAEFVRLEEEAERRQTGGSGVMPALCALASQLLRPGVLSGAGADAALEHMQGYFRQAVNSIDDLQSTIDSAWPLYGVLNAASVVLAQGGTG